jgi:hypothetical protein
MSGSSNASSFDMAAIIAIFMMIYLWLVLRGYKMWRDLFRQCLAKAARSRTFMRYGVACEDLGTADKW